jgi:hypothetical protein
MRRADLVADLEKEFGKGAVARGQTVFADNCARCHSSIPEADRRPFKSRDFAAPNDAHPRKVRADFLGNEQSTPVTEVGTFRCRSLHSNHKAGHLYMEYASDTLRKQQVVADIPERPELKDGGRGYLRNISLVNVWATAPFMHNNAIGPEICGKPANPDNDFHRARYVDRDGKLLATQPDCLRYDPTWKAASSSTSARCTNCCNPKERGSKRTLTNADLIIDLGIRPAGGKNRETFGRLRSIENPGRDQRRLPQWLAAQATGRRPFPCQAPSGQTGSQRQEGSAAYFAGNGRGHPQASDPLRRHPARKTRFPQCQLRNLHTGDRKRGPPLRRGPFRSRQEGADCLPGNDVSKGRSSWH